MYENQTRVRNQGESYFLWIPHYTPCTDLKIPVTQKVFLALVNVVCREFLEIRDSLGGVVIICRGISIKEYGLVVLCTWGNMFTRGPGGGQRQFTVSLRGSACFLSATWTSE